MTTTIEVNCDQCNKRIRAAEKHAGRTVACPNCQAPLTIPAGSAVSNSTIGAVEEKFALRCEGCHSQLKLAQRFRGKRIKCPKCQHVINVPQSASDSAAAHAQAAPPVAKAPPPRRPEAAAPPPKPAENWYLHAHDGQQYGPISRAELDGWMNEGLLTATCQICGDEGNWRPATELYPQLEAHDHAAPEDTGERLLTCKGNGPRLGSMAVSSDLKKTGRGNQIVRNELYQVGDARSMWERIKAGTVVGPFAQEKEIDVEQIHLLTFSDPAGEVHMVSPLDNGTPCPTEFICVLPGYLPTSLGLLRGEGGNWGIDASNSAAGVFLPQIARAAMTKMGGQAQSFWAVLDEDQSQAAADHANGFAQLRADLRFDAKVTFGPMEITYHLDWIAQALPLTDEEYLVVAKYIPKNKMFGIDLGASWFAQWRLQLIDCIAGLPDATEQCFCCYDYGNWGIVADEVLGLDVFK